MVKGKHFGIRQYEHHISELFTCMLYQIIIYLYIPDFGCVYIAIHWVHFVLGITLGAFCFRYNIGHIMIEQQKASEIMQRQSSADLQSKM